MIALTGKSMRARWVIAKENKLFWWSIALMASTLILAFMQVGTTSTPPSDLWIRAWGMLLQLLGVLTVWFNLLITGKDYGRHGVIKKSWNGLKAFVAGSKDGHAIGAFGACIANTSSRARVCSRRKIAPDAPLEERLAALEFNIQQIDLGLDSAYRSIAQVSDELTGKIDEESSKRKEEISIHSKRLEAVAVGNYEILLFGVFWLLAGIILSTLAPEITKFITT